MSAKRMQAGTPTEHRARSPAGPGAMAAGPREGSLSTTGSSGRSQTPLSGSGSFRHLSDTPGSSQQRGSSSHSSHHRDRDRHGSSANRVLAGTSGREGSGDGHSSASRIPPSSAAFDVPGAGGGAGGDPTPPLLHRRPEDSYDGLSPAAGHRRSLDLMQQQQQQMPRHRSGGSTTPSSGDNRAPTPRSGLFPTGRSDEKLPPGGGNSRWNPSSSSKDVASFTGRTNSASGASTGTLPSGTGTSPVPSPASGTYPSAPPAGLQQSQHHRESPQMKRHVHTHHHTHVINAAYPVYGQYPASLLPGTAPLVPAAVVFPDAYNPK